MSCNSRFLPIYHNYTLNRVGFDYTNRLPINFNLELFPLTIKNASAINIIHLNDLEKFLKKRKSRSIANSYLLFYKSITSFSELICKTQENSSIIPIISIVFMAVN